MGLRISTDCGSCDCGDEAKPPPVEWKPTSPPRAPNHDMGPQEDDIMDGASARLTVNQKIIMGIHLGKNDHHDKSKEYFEEALAVVDAATGGHPEREAEFADARAQIFENLGMLAYQQDDLDESETMLHKSLDLYMAAQNAPNTRNKAYIARNANEVGKALLEIQSLKQQKVSNAAVSTPVTPTKGQLSPGREEHAEHLPVGLDAREEAALQAAEGKGETSEESIHDAFNRFDTNDDHMLDLEEFTAYLTSVFENQRSRNPKLFRDHSPVDMARETAGLCFAEADLNNDGTLTFYEFKEWLQPKTVTVSPAKKASENAAVVAPMSDKTLWRLEAAEQAATAAAAAEDLAAKQKVKETEAAELSVSTGGVIDEATARRVFDKYDTNGDGVFDLSEFTEYLTSMFEALQPHNKAAFRMRSLSPREMANETAKQCFEEADRNHDGSLSFDEFKAWYSSSTLVGESRSPSAVAEVEGWREKAAASAAAAAEAAATASPQIETDGAAESGEDIPLPRA